MQSEELKPCPFCGGEPLEFRVPGFGRLWRIECRNCDAGPSSSLDIEVARTIWNTRVEAALSTDAEQVAYRVRMEGQVWQLRHVIHEFEKWDIVEPLYAAPPAPAVAVKALELLDRVIGYEGQDRDRLSEVKSLLLSALSAQVQDVAGWQDEEKLTPEEAWTTLCETPDITSPEEYPDHALITFEQLKSYMERAQRQDVSAPEGFELYGHWSKHRLSDGCFLPLPCYVPDGPDYTTIALYRASTAAKQGEAE